MRTLNVIAMAVGITAMSVAQDEKSRPQSSLAPDSRCIDLSESMRRDVASGRLEEAERTASAALAGEAISSEPACAALILSNMSAAMQIAGRLREAEAFAMRALAYLDKNFLPDDPAYSVPLYTLASVQFEEGMTGKARATFRRLQKIPTSNPKVRALVCGFGAVLAGIDGKWDVAEAEYKEAAAAFASAGRENSGDTAAILAGLATLYLNEWRYAEALKVVDRGLKTLDTTSDATPLDRIKILNLRGVILGRQGQWQGAENDLFEAFSLARGQAQADPVEFETLAANYAAVLRKVHRKREAEAVSAWGAARRSDDTTRSLVVDIAELAPRPAQKNH